MLRQVARPIPEPVFLVVKNGSKIFGRWRAAIPVPTSMKSISIPEKSPEPKPRTRTVSDPAARHGLHGIDRQIVENLQQLGRVGLDGGQVVGDLEMGFNG